MSASDAQQATKGQSLKERMAALQGAGAFGAPSPPSAPPVPAGTPKVWKRPVAPEPVEEPEAVEKKASKWTVEEGGEEQERREHEELESWTLQVSHLPGESMFDALERVTGRWWQGQGWEPRRGFAWWFEEEGEANAEGSRSGSSGEEEEEEVQE